MIGLWVKIWTQCTYEQLMVISDMNPGDGDVAYHNFLNVHGSFRMFPESPNFWDIQRVQ